MNNTKLAIQKAVEGGWNYWSMGGGAENSPIWEKAFLDPLFWVALGKTEGWNEYDPEDENHDCDRLGCSSVEHTVEDRYKLEQHRLIDAIKQGRSIDEFFGEILKK